jgi:hypothetical protein
MRQGGGPRLRQLRLKDGDTDMQAMRVNSGTGGDDHRQASNRYR